MAEKKSNAEAMARLRGARGFIFDIDGTLVLGDDSNRGFAPLPGALELLTYLLEADIPFVAFTNGTVRTPKASAGKLRGAGLPVEDAAAMTPSYVAADYLSRHEFERILVLGCEGVWRPLTEAGLTVVLPADMAGAVDAVYIGWYREFTMDDLETACLAVMAGAKLFTASDVPFFATARGRAFGTSFAISAMIKAVTGVEARVLGKPSLEALDCAARLLGVDRERIAVVGDDPLLEMRMARDGGALAVAVTTGLNDQAKFEGQEPGQRPDLIFSGVDGILSELRSKP